MHPNYICDSNHTHLLMRIHQNTCTAMLTTLAYGGREGQRFVFCISRFAFRIPRFAFRVSRFAFRVSRFALRFQWVEPMWVGFPAHKSLCTIDTCTSRAPGAGPRRGTEWIECRYVNYSYPRAPPRIIILVSKFS